MKLDSWRFAEMTSVAALVGSRNAYKESPLVVNWQAKLPGDCTELTVWAEEVLMALGWSRETISRWACKTENGKAHAVLILDLEYGMTAIDCRHSRPQMKDDLPYSGWVRIVERMPDSPHQLSEEHNT